MLKRNINLNINNIKSFKLRVNSVCLETFFNGAGKSVERNIRITVIPILDQSILQSFLTKCLIKVLFK